VPVGEEDILRLDVPVHHAARVRIREGVRNLAEEADRFGERDRPGALEALPERLPLDVRHDEVQRVRGLAGIVQSENVGVLEAGRDPDLAEKSLAAQRVGELRPKDLERHVSVVLGVARQEHLGGRAFTDFALDDVPAGEAGLRALHDLGHGYLRACERAGPNICPAVRDGQRPTRTASPRARRHVPSMRSRRAPTSPLVDPR
jgi:hypothetical protein